MRKNKSKSKSSLSALKYPGNITSHVLETLLLEVDILIKICPSSQFNTFILVVMMGFKSLMENLTYS